MDRSHTRSNFLGGEWSPSALGRVDLPTYDQSLSISFNGYPIEEGAWTKRGGTIYVGPTKNNNDGIIRTWYIGQATVDNSQIQCVQIELSYGPLATGGNAATLQVWRWPFTNNAPVYTVTDDGTRTIVPYDAYADVKNAEMIATDLGVFFLSKNDKIWILTYNALADTFSFADAHLEKLDGPYLDPLAGNSLTNNSTGVVDAASGDINFQITDGAYTFLATDVGRVIRLWNQPPQWDPSATYVAGTRVYNDGQFWNALPIWNGTTTIPVPAGVVPGTTYTQPITQSSPTAANPNATIVISPWALAPQQATWGFGYIKSVGTGGDFSKAVVTTVIGLPNAKAWSSTNSADAGNNGFVIDTWQLGVYTSKQYPATGCWHEGRLWLAGALPNRIDSSMSNGMNLSLSPGGQLIGTYGGLGPLFSPTDQFGNVFDDNGISEQFNSDGTNLPQWMIAEHSGILMGTPSAEWLITATNQNDPLTPTSIQIHKVTKYGSAKARAIRVGIAIAFIHTFGRRVFELVADVFSGRFVGRHLNEFAKHLSINQFHEVAYQEEPNPLIWASDMYGVPYSCTYRRVSHFGQEPPQFMAWSRHNFSRVLNGTSSRISSMSDTAINGTAGVTGYGSQSSIAMITGNISRTTPNVNFTDCQIELLHGYTEPEQLSNLIATTPGAGSWNVWHLDGAVTGVVGGALTISDTGPGASFMTITGIPSVYNQNTVALYLCGLDFGNYPVSNGTISVPYASDPDGIGTQAWIVANYVTAAQYWLEWSTPANINGVSCKLPCLVGLPFTSEFQVSRPATRDATEGRTGVAFGKTQRSYMWGGTFASTSCSSLVVSAKQTAYGQTAAGVVDNAISSPTIDYPVIFRYPNGTTIPKSTLFSGVFWDTIQSDYNFDNQITLTSTRPVPFTISAVTSFMNAEDR